MRTTPWRPARRPTSPTASPAGSPASADFGKSAFLDITDRSGKIQVQARKDVLGDESFDTLTGLDLGDVLGVDGTAFKSRRGELTLAATAWTLLAKSLLAPPPEKFHGLEDTETRYRRRELDLMANEEARELFILRSKVVAAVRRWLDERGFLEVETPVLQPLYGGALARPVHHPPQRARPRPVPADRHRAVPQAADRGRPRAGLRAGQGLPQRGPLAPSTTPSSRCSSGTRPTRTTPTSPPSSSSWSPSWRSEVGYEGEIDFSAPWKRVTLRDAIEEATGIDVLAPRPRRPGDGRPGARHRPRPDRELAQAGGRAAVQARRAEAGEPDLRARLPGRALPVRQGSPRARRARRALRVLRGRHGVRQRLHRAQRPRRAARSLRATSSRRPQPATRRPSPTTRTTSSPWSTACPPPAASA